MALPAVPLEPASVFERTSPSPEASVGAPGVAIYSGFVVEDEKDPRVTGLQKYRTFSDMLANVSIVSAGVRFFLNLVARANWKLVPPPDGGAEAERLAELASTILFKDMQVPWHRVVRRAALFKFYGFSIQEWTAVARADGLFGISYVESRAQRTIRKWDTDVHGRVLGVEQESPQDSRSIYLPRWKIIYLVDDSVHDSPEGMGLFRHIAYAAARLELYERLEAWAYETDLRGIPIGRGPLTALEQMVKAGTLSPEQALALRRPLEDFIRRHNRSPALGLVLDSAVYRAAGENQAPSATRQWDMELVRGTGGPWEDIAAAIERVNREIARVLGVEHLLLGSNDRGSYALSVDKSQAFGMIVDSALTEIRESFQRDLLGTLWDLNGWDRALMPTLKNDQAQYRDILQVTGALKDLAAAGSMLMPDDPAVGEVRDLIGLSRPEPGDASLLAQAALDQAEKEAAPDPAPVVPRPAS